MNMKKAMCCVGTIMAMGSVMAFAGSCKMTGTKCLKRMIKKKASKMADVIDIVTSMM